MGDTLTCILSQTVQDFEAIVVDDGSTDEGGALVETARDPRFRLLRQANLGVSAARNRGILEAQAEWVALLDADDLWLSTHLADLVSAVQDAGVIGAFTNYIFESRGLPAVENGVPSQRVDDYFSFALANGGYPMHTSSVLFRREQLIDCGLFAVGKSMGEDIDMWCRLAFHGSFQYVARPSATYRDALDSSAVARNLRREAPFPVFAQRLPDMISGGDRLVVPSATVCKLLAAGACAATFRPRRAFSSRRGTAAAVHASMGSQAVPEATLEDIVTR